ncbi:hypothetical protein FVB9288_01980 [Flavobacterium sp. CECT 9288]|uniref:hypothetical protein n=1 Tax=Flavobacterium sp. CECT 9288 TaxID=2845819 RepID=UPI001E29DC95|nr:hypothetical protein [Flavobacterium sp. CECT 9288]CAH0336294.1 hypothetical protein FVB9288_01980 [Flavobacterium sp. CECT 9288]
MRYCIISYDYFGYDKHIVIELQKRNLNVTHIDISKFHFSYSSKFQKINNFFTKLFFKKNVKQIELKKFIFNQLLPLGKQDIILVIRPDLISRETHLEIKKQTSEYVCYLYDSCTRFNIKNLTKGVFERIYSFDKDDVEKFGFMTLTNYIFLEKKEIRKSFKFPVFIIMSVDERLTVLNLLVEKLYSLGIDSKCIVISPKNPESLHPSIQHLRENINPIEVQNLMNESEIFIDLIRKNHNGLSFRIFEALAFQRKTITTNQSIKNYDFYNPNNILIITENDIKINKSFFETSYQPIKDEIFHKYSIQNWVNTIFKL